MLSKTEAAYNILKHHRKPLHVKEIIKIALSEKMIVTKGKTPESTLGSDMYTENNRRREQGRKPRFCHVGPGMWGLTEWKK